MLLKRLFYICFFLLSLGQLVNVSRSEGLNLYLFDGAVFFFALVGLIYFLFKKQLVINKVFIGLLSFCTVGAASLIFNFFLNSLSFWELTNSAFYLLRFCSYIISGLIVSNMINTGILSKKELKNSSIGFGVFLAIMGFIQLIVLPDFETLDPSLGWDPHKNRLSSTFFDPNYMGGFLCICFALLLDNFYKKEFKKSDVIKGLILVLAIFLTFSRSAWIMFSIIITIYALFKDARLLMLAAFIAFSAYFFVPRVQTRISGVTDPADSAQFRFISWQNSVEIIKDNWIYGVGFNSYRYAQRDYGFFGDLSYGGNSGAGTDSSLLFVLATTGVVGLAIYILSFSYLMFYKLDILNIALGTSLLIESQFINSLFYPQILFLIMVVAALSFSIKQKSLHT